MQWGDIDFLWAILLSPVVLIYVGLCLLFYFFQYYFFFRPEILPRYFEYQFPFPFEEVNFDMEDGGRINAIHFRVPNSLGVVYYLKGNSRSLKGWGKFAKDFVGKGYDFFMIDYRGFGKSKGKRTEATLYNDAQTVYKWLSGEYGQEQIVIYGRSMGSGIAARIAAWNHPRMLILDSPYYSFLHTVRRFAFFFPLRWLLRYHLRTDRFITQVTSPIYLIHGDRDRLIPYRESVMLHELTPERSILVTIHGGKHNNLPKLPQYHQKVYDILNREALAYTAPQAKSLPAED
jgi:hypothetical protein